MRKVDKEMRKMEINLVVELGNNNLTLTDKTVGNHKLVNFGYCGQKITVQKQGLTLQANICGVTVDTYYSFDTIFGFAMIFKDSCQAYASNMAI